jgi:pimeloyl-ACP methyl ester carboxylesterase
MPTSEAPALVLERNGCSLHAWLAGPADAPLIVCTHGAGADHRMFDAQRAALTERYQVLTWDVRGHGRSRPMGAQFSLACATDDLVALLDAVGADAPALLGQSMGGNISQELVYRYPQRARALILIDCVCNTFPLTLLEWFGVWITPTLLRLYPRQTLLRQSANAVSRRPEVRQYLYEAMAAIPNDDLLAILVGTLGGLHDDPDYRIPLPFLLLRGEQDRAGSIAKQAPRWAARDPSCRYVVVPDAGHCANQDNPAFVNAQILCFLDALPQHSS